MADIAPLTTALRSLDLARAGDRLRPAFVARYGLDVGLEVTSEVMAWAWANQDELAAATNPAGLLYRVGQSRSRQYLRWRRDQVRFPAEPAVERDGRWVEPGLARALATLAPDQRQAVVLVHCLQWTYPEVSELLDVPLHTVRNRVHRGMQRLRISLGVEET
jgi:RNA polymerase sigma factor (sigma-70 family)